MDNVIQRIEEIGIVPLYSVENIEHIDFVAHSLIDGNIPCVEVAYRTELAQQGIAYISNKYPNILVGAGTVTSIEQAKSAIESGASFLISPGLDEEIVAYAQKNNIAIIPGVMTPSEIQRAIKCGLNRLKLFPVSLLGLGYINSVSAAFDSVKFMPTGGVKETNYIDYLENEHVFACSGSWLLPSNLIRENRRDELISIISSARRGVEDIRG